MNSPASRPPHSHTPPPPNTLVPETGWHCGHYFYRFRRELLHDLDGADEFIAALDPPTADRTERLQPYIISGHKADFAIMAMDPDPLKIDALHQQLLSGPLGPAIEPTWSFISLSEVSEYVPSVEQFRENLVVEGVAAGSPELEERVQAYAARLPMMNHQRLTPEFSDWPAACFYPMNKSRVVGANWFTTPFSHRRELMSEHARSGIAFAGRVSQVITVGVGLDDWEWMVTLWARNPQYLKDIVYKMRFDEASAAYAEFGPFYTGYRASGEEILRHCRLIE
ncbi:MAG: hydrogen peroxide-dependent heme synthase [Planctomycetaceae bacterium]